MSKYSLKTPKAYKLSEESATESVVQLLEYYDIDIDRAPDVPADGSPQSPREALERALDQLTDYVRLGAIEIVVVEENELTVVQHLTGGYEITYREVSAKAKLAMDRVKGGGNYARIYAMMASLASLPPAAIEKMAPRDLAVVEILGTVFSNA